MFSQIAQQSNGAVSSAQDFEKFASSLPGIGPEMRSMGAPGEPTADDMEKQMEAVRFTKKVLIKDVQVRTYNLSNPKDVEDYRETYLKLYQMVAEGKIMFKSFEKKFVSDAEGSRWLLHLEWLEYDLKVTDHQMKRDGEDGQRAPVQYRPTDGH
jgi:hypothetical protein